MHSTKTTSKTSMLNRMLLKGWRERWSEFQWGIHVKSVLPRGVSGDVYDLATIILEQAIGVGANKHLLSYLKHSLCSHLISHAAVLKRISKYNSFDRYYCLNILLDFLISVIDGVTCRSKPEEGMIVNSTLSLVNWIADLYLAILDKVFQSSGNITSDQQECIKKILPLLEKIVGNEYLIGILYLSKFEEPELFEKLRKNYMSIKTHTHDPSMTRLTTMNTKIMENVGKIVWQKIENLEVEDMEVLGAEAITYCIQPLLAVDVLTNPSADNQVFVNELLMIQRLKGYSNARLYCEVMKGGLICMNDVNGTSRDSVFCAFTFIKLPHIFKLINDQTKGERAQVDVSDDIAKAFDMLLENYTIIDLVDIKNNCNAVEIMLTALHNLSLVNENCIQFFSKRRESHLANLQKVEVSATTQSVKYVMRAEAPLSGILKTLASDYNKVQEHLLSMLGQVLSGNSLELILSVASIEGKLKIFTQRLIKCNEYSKQVPGETGKPALIRLALFDVSFLMLFFIVQTYGSETVLEENGKSFFDTWVRDCMVEKNKEKSPMQMVRVIDSHKVDELLVYFNSPDSPNKKLLTMKWQEVPAVLPAVVYNILLAWENETLSAADVKNILENMRSKLLCFSVCAATWLCAYLQVVKQDELLKPLNLLQQLTAVSPEDISQKQENAYKERLGLTAQIIQKMQQTYNPSGNPKVRAFIHSQNLVSNKPMSDIFDEQWKFVSESSWLPITAAQTFESLLQSCGHFWFVNKLVDKIFQCKFIKDMEKTKDIIFGIMHLDIEKCTIALLSELLPILLNNKDPNCKIVEPYSRILAKLCVYCIIATESPNCVVTKKRSRNIDSEDFSPNSKSRKLAVEQTSVSSGLPVEFGGESVSNVTPMSEPLQKCLQNLFKNFQLESGTDKLTPKSYFVFEFFTILVQSGSNERIKPILKLISSGLSQHLLKIIPNDLLKAGFVLRLYDLGIASGRQQAVSDLCLLRNIQIRSKNSTKL